jgi:hypothetical protein
MKSFLSFFFVILFFSAFVNGGVVAGRGEVLDRNNKCNNDKYPFLCANILSGCCCKVACDLVVICSNLLVKDSKTSPLLQNAERREGKEREEGKEGKERKERREGRRPRRGSGSSGS